MSEPIPDARPPSAASAAAASLQPNRADPDPTAVDLQPHRWMRVETGDTHGHVLDVHYIISGPVTRAVLGRATVDETPTEVTITLQVGRPAGAPPSGGPLAMLAAEMVTSVRLARPLGRRTVRDGALGR